MDADEQELAEIQSAFTHGIAASNEAYRTKISELFAFHIEQLRGASDEEQKRLWEEYEQKRQTLLQECIERDREIIAIHAQRQNAVYERLRNTPNEIVSSFWRVRVSGIAEEAPRTYTVFFRENRRSTAEKRFGNGCGSF
jgi:hypothetical protein